MATLMQKLTNPLAMLAADHEYVKQTLKTCLSTGSPTARRLLIQEICDNLEVHATLEEELFYPALARMGGEEGRRFVDEATRAHREIKNRMEDVKQGDVRDQDFRMRVGALEEHVLRHAEREEQIFPLAEERLPLGELATHMDMQRLQLLAKVRPPSGLAMIALVLIGIGAFLFVTMRRSRT